MTDKRQRPGCALLFLLAILLLLAYGLSLVIFTYVFPSPSPPVGDPPAQVAPLPAP
jgi:hypothetical protein